MSAFVRSRGPISDMVVAPFQPFSSLVVHGSTSDIPLLLKPVAGAPSNRLLSVTPSQYASLDMGAVDDRVQVMERHTFHLTTSPFDQAPASWSSAPRRVLRKHQDDYVFQAFAAGSPGEDSQRVEAISRTADLAEAAYARHGRSLPLPKQETVAWAEDLVTSGLGCAYGLYSKDSGELEAGLVSLFHRRKAWYWLAGSKQGPGMTVLMAHVQSDLNARGIPILDLMGANTPGIAEFKRRFGGERVAYGHLCTASWVSRLAERWASTLKRPRSQSREQ